MAFCVKCGLELQEDWIHCSKCGEVQKGKQRTSKESHKTRPLNKGSLVKNGIILIASIVVFIWALGRFFS